MQETKTLSIVPVILAGNAFCHNGNIAHCFKYQWDDVVGSILCRLMKGSVEMTWFPKQIEIFVDLSCTWICISPFTPYRSRAEVAVIFCHTQTGLCAFICNVKQHFGSWLETLNIPAWGCLKDSGCCNHAIASYKENMKKINSGGNAGKTKPNIIPTQMFYSAWNE